MHCSHHLQSPESRRKKALWRVEAPSWLWWGCKAVQIRQHLECWLQKGSPARPVLRQLLLERPWCPSLTPLRLKRLQNLSWKSKIPAKKPNSQLGKQTVCPCLQLLLAEDIPGQSSARNSSLLLYWTFCSAKQPAQRVAAPKADATSLFVLIHTIWFPRYNSQEKDPLLFMGGSDILSTIVQAAVVSFPAIIYSISEIQSAAQFEAGFTLCSDGIFPGFQSLTWK